MTNQQPFDYSSYPGQQPAPTTAPSAPAAKKKKRKVGCLGWTLGIIAILGVFSLATGGGDDDSTQTGAAPADQTSGVSAAADTDPAVPSDHRSALRSAKTYSKTMNMSKQDIFDQLTSEYGGQYSAEAAQYAVDNVEADWNLNALESARTYQKTMNMSPDAIHGQLTSEYGGKFTTEQADYAIAELTGAAADSTVPTEYTSALRQAETYSELMHMSKAGLYDQLVSEYGGQFTAEAAQYAVDNVEADWNLNALESARTYQETMNMSPSAIWDQLVSEYGGQFTAEQADYAIAHLN